MNTALAYDIGPEIIEHRASLRRYARTLTRTVEEAEDLVQDCIVRALSRPHLYQRDTNLRAWLLTILRNVALTHSRKAKYRRAHATERAAMEPHISAPNQVHRVALRESVRLVNTLPARERQAVRLLGIFNMSYEEAARHSGSEVGTMKSRLSRGRERLRRLAGEEPAGLGEAIR